jgi:hypothetical protein
MLKEVEGGKVFDVSQALWEETGPKKEVLKKKGEGG